MGGETLCGRKNTVSWKRHMSKVDSGFVWEGMMFQMSLFLGLSMNGEQRICKVAKENPRNIPVSYKVNLRLEPRSF